MVPHRLLGPITKSSKNTPHPVKQVGEGNAGGCGKTMQIACHCDLLEQYRPCRAVFVKITIGPTAIPALEETLPVIKPNAYFY